MQKIIALTALALALTACTETATSVVEAAAAVVPNANAASAPDPYVASGMNRAAIIGSTQNPGMVDLFFYTEHTDNGQIKDAPANLCSYYGETLVSYENNPHPSPEYYKDARVLNIKCSG